MVAQIEIQLHVTRCNLHGDASLEGFAKHYDTDHRADRFANRSGFHLTAARGRLKLPPTGDT